LKGRQGTNAVRDVSVQLVIVQIDGSNLSPVAQHSQVAPQAIVMQQHKGDAAEFLQRVGPRSEQVLLRIEAPRSVGCLRFFTPWA